MSYHHEVLLCISANISQNDRFNPDSDDDNDRYNIVVVVGCGAACAGQPTLDLSHQLRGCFKHRLYMRFLSSERQCVSLLWPPSIMSH